MTQIKDLYKTVVETVCRNCMTDPVMMFSSNKERCVDSRGLLIVVLSEYKFSESLISDLTGLSQQAVNRLKNIYPDRIRRQYLLCHASQQIHYELTTTLPQDNFHTKNL